MRKLILAAAFVLAMSLYLPGVAMAEEEVELPEVELSYENVTWEQGRKVFEDICWNCHSMLYHRNPATGKPYLQGKAETPAEQEEKRAGFKESFGKIPPDLTVMTNAREGGPEYIYALLMGFEEDTEKKCTTGSFNKYFPGNCMAMPKQGVTEEQAKDVASFLWYTAEPTLLVREEIGWRVVPFSFVFMLVLYVLKKKMWSSVKGKH